MIFVCSGSIGIIMARTYLARPANLQNLYVAIQLLETEISYARTTLPEACQRIASQTKKPISEFFQRFVAHLESENALSALEAWEQSLTVLRDSGFLKTDVETVAQLGNVLGRSDAEDQLKHLSLLQNRLSTSIKQAEQDRDRNVRLWNYLGFCVGILVILLLY